MELDPLGTQQVEYAPLQSHPTFIQHEGRICPLIYASPLSSVLVHGEHWNLNCPGQKMLSSKQGQQYCETERAGAVLWFGSESLVVSLDLGS